MDVVTLTDISGQLIEEEICGAGRIRARVEGDDTTLQRGLQFDIEMLDSDIGHPKHFRKQLTQHHRTRLALDNGDGG